MKTYEGVFCSSGHDCRFGHADVISCARGKTIYQIYDQFILSNAVASSCYKNVDPDLLLKFGHNFNAVLAAAAQDMMKNNPGLDIKLAKKTLEDRMDLLTKQAKEKVKETGCEDPQAKNMVELFKRLAALTSSSKD